MPHKSLAGLYYAASATDIKCKSHIPRGRIIASASIGCEAPKHLVELSKDAPRSLLKCLHNVSPSAGSFLPRRRFLTRGRRVQFQPTNIRNGMKISCAQQEHSGDNIPRPSPRLATDIVSCDPRWMLCCLHWQRMAKRGESTPIGQTASFELFEQMLARAALGCVSTVSRFSELFSHRFSFLLVCCAPSLHRPKEICNQEPLLNLLVLPNVTLPTLTCIYEDGGMTA